MGALMRFNKMEKKKNTSIKSEKGLVIVNTGEGKGKTTSAIGVAIRALGWGHKVLLVQFMKGSWETGEFNFLGKLSSQVKIISADCPFSWATKDKEKDVAICRKVWDSAKEYILDSEYELIILDEVNIATSLGYLVEQEVIETLKQRKPSINIILTGRGAKKRLIDYADIVSEINCVKHPFHSGVVAKKGIDF
jgi:cob(I)alamin adenosyltransferase